MIDSVKSLGKVKVQLIPVGKTCKRVVDTDSINLVMFMCTRMIF